MRQGAHRGQRIEQEVRLHLRAQKIELRAVEFGFQSGAVERSSEEVGLAMPHGVVQEATDTDQHHYHEALGDVLKSGILVKQQGRATIAPERAYGRCADRTYPAKRP